MLNTGRLLPILAPVQMPTNEPSFQMPALPDPITSQQPALVFQTRRFIKHWDFGGRSARLSGAHLDLSALFVLRWFIVDDKPDIETADGIGLDARLIEKGTLAH